MGAIPDVIVLVTGRWGPPRACLHANRVKTCGCSRDPTMHRAAARPRRTAPASTFIRARSACQMTRWVGSDRTATRSLLRCRRSESARPRSMPLHGAQMPDRVVARRPNTLQHSTTSCDFVQHVAAQRMQCNTLRCAAFDSVAHRSLIASGGTAGCSYSSLYEPLHPYRLPSRPYLSLTP